MRHFVLSLLPLLAVCAPQGGTAARAITGGVEPAAPADRAALGTCAPSLDAPLRRLTPLEYEATANALLGTDERVAALLPASTGAVFSTAAEAQVASGVWAEALVDAAERLAAAADLGRWAPCGVTDACFATFVRGLGGAAFRRPLTDDEEARWRALYEALRRDDPPLDAYRAVVAGLLAAPQFTFRVEPLQPGGGLRPLGGAEVASRLAFFLWGQGPDATLLSAAADGGLASRAQVADRASLMLRDPRARAQVARFHQEWLGVGALTHATKDDPRFAGARQSMIDEVGHFGAWATLDDGRFTSLYRARTSFLNGPLGELYGLAVPNDGVFHETSLARVQRQGLLTLPGVLAAWAKPDQSSPVLRGKLVRERLLCQVLPSPPANVVVVLPPPTSGTTRQRLAAHVADPSCAGCHRLIDPPGFLFEHYDAVGAYRAEENLQPVNARGAVPGHPDFPAEYDGALALGDALAASASARRCVAQQWLQFARGREATEADACLLDELAQTLAPGRDSLSELLVQLASSDAMRFVRQEAAP